MTGPAFSMSWTSIQKYRACPALAYWDVVERAESRLPWRPNAGKVVASVIEDHARRVIQGKPTLQAAELEELVRDRTKQLWDTIQWHQEAKEAQEERTEFIPRSYALALHWLQEVGPQMEILDVERRITIRLPELGTAVTGIVDQWLVDGVADTKTVGQMPGREGDRAHRTQVALYSLGWTALYATQGEAPAASARIDYLVLSEQKKRTPMRQVRHLPVLMGPSELRQEAAVAMELIAYVADGVRRGDFRRDVSACDSIYFRRCPHYHRCQPWRASPAEQMSMAAASPGGRIPLLPQDRADGALMTPIVEVREITSKLTHSPVFGGKQP